MQSRLIIRRSTPSDIPAIAEMMLEFEAWLLTLIGKRRKFNLKAFEKSIRFAMDREVPLAHGLIAERRGKPVGYIIYCLMFRTDSRKPAIYVQDLFVRPSAQAKGNGKALMLEMKRIAREMKCSDVIWTVWNRNPEALGFYLSLGAKPVTDEIIMEWDVRGRK